MIRILCLLLLLCPLWNLAQKSVLTGNIRSATDTSDPIADASLRLLHAGLQSWSQPDGSFRFNNTKPPLQYEIHALSTDLPVPGNNLWAIHPTTDCGRRCSRQDPSTHIKCTFYILSPKSQKRQTGHIGFFRYQMRLLHSGTSQI